MAQASDESLVLALSLTTYWQVVRSCTKVFHLKDEKRLLQNLASVPRAIIGWQEGRNVVDSYPTVERIVATYDGGVFLLSISRANLENWSLIMKGSWILCRLLGRCSKMWTGTNSSGSVGGKKVRWHSCVITASLLAYCWQSSTLLWTLVLTYVHYRLGLT